ncbi:unnamed protein product [Phaedon cochleariae]|uniref:Beta-hexosaminidase n=1 Tax=Phaedon cochleariae TaxID=80249 RepID=A0A9N9SCG4_PHACE|nr:unnamed protein product [Phaedon cochleariae]
MKFSQLTIVALVLIGCESYIEKPGPRYVATKGEPWPKPQTQIKNDEYFVLRPQFFEFQVKNNAKCTLLHDAVLRYQSIISGLYESVDENLKFVSHQHHKKEWLSDNNFIGHLESAIVDLSGSCDDNDYPSQDMKENYSINITPDNAEIQSSTIWGILRGLETFSQLIYIADDYVSLRINTTSISDYPRFAHRGLLLDTSRHFIPVKKMLENLDAMAYNKLNVFHWHIVDDQSFPYVSRKYPELSEQGAYKPSQVYTPAVMQQIVEYARVRGIRVITEFDTPGHTRSWGVAHPEVLTACGGNLAGEYGPMDPSKVETYNLLAGLLGEVSETFPDQYIHLGGDEVDFDCWESNANISKFMKKENITDYKGLESYFVQRVINIVDALKAKSIVWEEVFENGVKLPTETIVQVWKGPWEQTMSEVTLSGKTAILSSCWYLDHLDSYGDWQKFYNCEPYNFTGVDSQKKLVLGGEACMWAEVVNEFNVISRVWPRASAAAEKLWSAENVTDIKEATLRLEEHVCRMNRRGVGAQPPSGPGFCP